jgi:transposase
VRRVLAVAAHTALKERQLVINHFNNVKSLIEIAEIIKRSHSALQNIVERYKKENRLTSKMRKIAKKNFTA